MSEESVIRSPAATAGFFGKIPSKGDFLTRRLPDEFVTPWDDWLQSGIAASKESMGADWLPAYLNGPIWRFVLPSGICGESLWAGVLMPSVDRVGRYFPLTVAVRVEMSDKPFQIAYAMNAWLRSAEDAMLDVLESGENGLETFDEELVNLPVPHIPEQTVGVSTGSGSAAACCSLDIGSVDSVVDECAAIVDGLLAERCAGYSLWWTDGGERVKPCLRVFEGLPPVERFAALFGAEGATASAPSALFESDETAETDADEPPAAQDDKTGNEET